MGTVISLDAAAREEIAAEASRHPTHDPYTPSFLLPSGTRERDMAVSMGMDAEEAAERFPDRGPYDMIVSMTPEEYDAAEAEPGGWVEAKRRTMAAALGIDLAELDAKRAAGANGKDPYA
ncbi:MAG: hypothetical protein JRE71_19740 [Deltaproteobacteria bacterium]|nr:hypothetical protein [Deltaproteobacteria bacterium]